MRTPRNNWVIFSILLVGLDWGLPSNERVKHLFENKEVHKKYIPKLKKTYAEEKIKTKNKIYIDNYLKYTETNVLATFFRNLHIDLHQSLN